MAEQARNRWPWTLGAAWRGGWTRRRRRRLAGAGAALTLVGLQLWPFGPGASADDVLAVIPTELPNYSHLNGTVEGAPAGPALGAFAHGQGVEFLDIPQAAVLSADGRSYRQVGTAQRASVAADQGDPAPYLLSPDGTALAVGSNGEGGRLAVVDLVTGDVQRTTVREGTSTAAVGWSADSTTVFVELTDGPVNRHGPSGRGSGDALARVDRTARGLADAVPLPGVAGTVVALPDGRILVTQDERTELRTGDGQTVLAPDTGVPTSIWPGAVSPDGVRVAGPGGGKSVWVAELGRDGSAGTPSTLTVEGLHDYGAEVLGWLDDDTLLLGSHDNETNSLRLHLHTLSVTTGAAEEVSIADPGWTGAAIIGVSVAADVLAGATVTEVSVIDRGRVPRVLGMAAWTVLVVLGVGLVRRAVSRRNAVRTGLPMPGSGF